MRRIGVIVALGALLSMLGVAVTASPALAGTGTKQLHLAVTSLQFTSVTCVDPSDPSCSVVRSTIVADASSNLSTGKGSFQVTGGTGAFDGATGGGHEFSAASASAVSPVIFNGTITF